MKRKKPSHELLTLMNVGPATFCDLEILNISTIRELASADADELYYRIQKVTGQKHDPCVWDVFSAIIHEAKTGEKKPWWKWTSIRKKRQNSGNFPLQPIS